MRRALLSICALVFSAFALVLVLHRYGFRIDWSGNMARVRIKNLARDNARVEESRAARRSEPVPVPAAVAKIPPPTGERSFKMSEVGGIVSRPVLYMLALFLFLYVACEVGVWNWLAS